MEDLTIVIKTFIRYGVCRASILKYQKALPGVPIIVVDDTPMKHRQELNMDGVHQEFMKPDVGLSAGRNHGFKIAQTENIFYTDDDGQPLPGMDMIQAYEIYKDADIDLMGWQAFSANVEGRTLIIKKGRKLNGLKKCDVCQNLFFAKRDFLLEFPYHEGAKINGEHYKFFWDIKQAGRDIYAHSCMQFVNKQTPNAAYKAYRRRNFRRSSLRTIDEFDNVKWTK